MHVLAFSRLRPMHRRLKILGIRVSLLEDKLLVRDECFEESERVVALSRDAKEEWLEMALAIHRIDPVDAICAFHEMNQEKAAIFAQKVGLPFHSLETIECVRQKDKMREKLRVANLDTTQGARVYTAQEIVDFASIYGYPIILKPVADWGSRGVSLVKTAADIKDAINWFHRSGARCDMYVEQYLQGEEFSVEALSEYGEHAIFCITKKYKDPLHFVEQGHCVPATISSDLEQNIRIFVSQVLVALGIRNGASHTEIMITEAGFRVVETHTRLGGDFIPDLFKLVSRIDVQELWARQVAGEQVIQQLSSAEKLNSFAAIWYALPQAVGTMVSVEGEEDASAMPGVVRVKILAKPGSSTNGTMNSSSRCAMAIAEGCSPEAALSQAQQAISRLKFVVSCHG